MIINFYFPNSQDIYYNNSPNRSYTDKQLNQKPKKQVMKKSKRQDISEKQEILPSLQNVSTTTVELNVTKKDIIDLIISKKKIELDNELDKLEKEVSSLLKSSEDSFIDFEKLAIQSVKNKIKGLLSELNIISKPIYTINTYPNDNLCRLINMMINCFNDQNCFNTEPILERLPSKIKKLYARFFHQNKFQHYRFTDEIIKFDKTVSVGIFYDGFMNGDRFYSNNTKIMSRSKLDYYKKSHENPINTYNINYNIDFNKAMEKKIIASIGDFNKIIDIVEKAVKIDQLKLSLKKEESKIKVAIIEQALKQSPDSKNILDNIDVIVKGINFDKLLK